MSRRVRTTEVAVAERLAQRISNTARRGQLLTPLEEAAVLRTRDALKQALRATRAHNAEYDRQGLGKVLSYEATDNEGQLIAGLQAADAQTRWSVRYSNDPKATRPWMLIFHDHSRGHNSMVRLSSDDPDDLIRIAVAIDSDLDVVELREAA